MSGQSEKKKKAVNNLRDQLGLSRYTTLGGKELLEQQVRSMLEKAFAEESEKSEIIDRFLKQFRAEILDFWA